MKKNKNEYHEGDIVLFKKIVGHYSSSKGSVRGARLKQCVGLTGEVIFVYPGARLYPYAVKFSNNRSYRMMAEELEPLFTI